jgi:hypothetical protein
VAENNATNDMFNDLTDIEGNNSTAKRNFYSSISWVAFPMLESGHSLLETDVKIKLRINKEYKNYVATGQNNGQPMYSWNMDDISSDVGSIDHLAEALQLINVVPNPYNAYSAYERNRIDTRVKITNLPEKCEIKIFSTQGKLVKTFSKDSPVTFIDWLLVNNKGVPIASGVYLIHVDVPGIGERVIKSFVSMRQVDLQGL